MHRPFIYIYMPFNTILLHILPHKSVLFRISRSFRRRQKLPFQRFVRLQLRIWDGIDLTHPSCGRPINARAIILSAVKPDLCLIPVKYRSLQLYVQYIRSLLARIHISKILAHPYLPNKHFHYLLCPHLFPIFVISAFCEKF